MEKAIVYSFESRQPIQLAQKTPKKRLRIRWNRVGIAIGVLALLIYGAISLVSMVTGHASNWLNSYQETSYQKELSKYETVEVFVEAGRTAWEIQKELTPNEQDLRHALSLSESLNPGVQIGDVQAGQTLLMVKELPHEGKTLQASEK